MCAVHVRITLYNEAVRLFLRVMTRDVHECFKLWICMKKIIISYNLYLFLDADTLDFFFM